jgi:hypothetical protein
MIAVFVLAMVYQVFGSRVEVVEDVLLVEQPAAVVPRLAVLAAAAQVGQGKVAEVLREEQPGDAEAETMAAFLEMHLMTGEMISGV